MSDSTTVNSVDNGDGTSTVTTKTDKTSETVTIKTLATAAMQLREYATKVAEEKATEVVVHRDAERQAIEDERANKRNFNRLLTLIGALVIGLFVTYSLEHGWYGAFGTTLAPYSFCITILLDSALAVYGLVKHY